MRDYKTHYLHIRLLRLLRQSLGLCHHCYEKQATGHIMCEGHLEVLRIKERHRRVNAIYKRRLSKKI